MTPKLIYPYYHLFSTDSKKLIGLSNSSVIIQKKYPDEKTFVITSHYGNEVLIGNKKEIIGNVEVIPVEIRKYAKKNLDFFHEKDNILFYGSLLNKTFVLWDAWDKYNKIWLNIEKEIPSKLLAHKNYSGKFNISLLTRYNNHIYRFKRPMLTYYYVS